MVGFGFVRGGILLYFVQCVAGGLNASWLYPTVGCFATDQAARNATNNTICDNAVVCQDVYLQVSFGSTLYFTLAATDNTTSARDGIRHCNDPNEKICSSDSPPVCSGIVNCPANPQRCSTRQCYPTTIERLPTITPADPVSSGTGYNAFLQDSEINFFDPSIGPFIGLYGSPFIGYKMTPYIPTISNPPTQARSPSFTTSGAKVTNLYPAYNNVTRVDFNWTVPHQEDVALASIPLYQLKFRARYASNAPLFVSNTSSCNKSIYIRICGAPSFVEAGSKFQDQNTSQVFFQAISSPTWSNSESNGTSTGFSQVNPACGVDNDFPCLTPLIPSVRNGANVLITTYQESAPTPASVMKSSSVGSSMPVMGVRVGQLVHVTVAARTIDPANSVQLKVFEDPGLPIGMNRSSQYPCIDTATVCMDLMWTPHVGQDNYVHEAALVAVQTSSPSIPASLKPCPSTTSTTLIIRFPVTTAVSSWVQPAASLMLDPRNPGNAVVGTQYSLQLQCQSNYHPLVRFASASAQGSLVQTAMTYLGGGEWLATYNYSYTPMDGDTLESLTRRYQLNTNWLNLWNANPAITDPDLELMPGSKVRLGPTYLARAGDTLSSIAGMFSTTVKLILSVNPSLNLLPGMALMPGSSVCVLACTSQQSPSNTDLWPAP